MVLDSVVVEMAVAQMEASMEVGLSAPVAVAVKALALLAKVEAVVAAMGTSVVDWVAGGKEVVATAAMQGVFVAVVRVADRK